MTCQIWRPSLLKDIVALETVRLQNSYLTTTADRAIKRIVLLPLMMIYERVDICFFVRSIKTPNNSFNNLSFVEFNSGFIRLATRQKLKHSFAPKSNSHRHYYFLRLVRLWNALPAINLNQSYKSITRDVKETLIDHFIDKFETSNPCSFYYCCPCNKCIIK